MRGVLRRLTEQLGLKREDVVENSIDASALEAMLGDDPRTIEVAAQRRAQRSINARLSLHLSFFEQEEATIERELPGPVGAYLHLRLYPALRPCQQQ